MIKVAFASSFKCALKKKVKNNTELEQQFWKSLKLFIEHPFSKALKTHKLSGNLKNLWSFSVEYDLRVIFYFTENKQEAILVDIGTHDEVY